VSGGAGGLEAPVLRAGRAAGAGPRGRLQPGGSPGASREAARGSPDPGMAGLSGARRSHGRTPSHGNPPGLCGGCPSPPADGPGRGPPGRVPAVQGRGRRLEEGVQCPGEPGTSGPLPRLRRSRHVQDQDSGPCSGKGRRRPWGSGPGLGSGHAAAHPARMGRGRRCGLRPHHHPGGPDVPGLLPSSSHGGEPVPLRVLEGLGPPGLGVFGGGRAPGGERRRLQGLRLAGSNRLTNLGPRPRLPAESAPAGPQGRRALPEPQDALLAGAAPPLLLAENIAGVRGRRPRLRALNPRRAPRAGCPGQAAPPSAERAFRQRGPRR